MWLRRSWRPSPASCPVRAGCSAGRPPDRAPGRVADAERGRPEPADQQLDPDGAVAGIDHDPVALPAVGRLDGRPAGQLEIATRALAHEVIPRGMVGAQAVDVAPRGIGGHGRQYGVGRASLGSDRRRLARPAASFG